MIHACTLEKSVFPLKQLREATTEALKQVLETMQLGSMELVIESRLWNLFHHYAVLGGEDFQRLHVKEVHALDQEANHHKDTILVYLIRPQVTHVHLVCEHIKRVKAKDIQKANQCVIIHAGAWNSLCADTLSRAGLADQVTLHSFALGFIPIDNDLITYGHDFLLKDCYIHGNKTCLAELGHALHLLQNTIGEIPLIFYKGELSKAVWKNLAQSNAESPPPTRQKKQRIDCLLILDRKLDFFAPFSTPLTHEALLDDLLGYRDGVVAVDPVALALDGAGQDKVEWNLNGDDEVFEDIRDKHIQAIGPYLHSTSAVFAEERKQLEETLRCESTTVKQLDELGTRLNQHMDKCSSLARHISLAEIIQQTTKSKEFKKLWQLEKNILQRECHLGDIQTLIWKNTSIYTVLRLLLLHCAANNGLPKQEYQQLKTQCLHQYGYEYLHVFENLETMGLLSLSNVKAVNVLEAWQLTGHFDCDPINPDHPAYVSGGYCPLIVKLVEAALDGAEGWKPLDHHLSHLPGPSAVLTTATKPKKLRKILVVVVGGITPMERTALRFLGQKHKCSFLLASDSIVGSRNLLDQAMEPIPNGLI